MTGLSSYDLFYNSNLMFLTKKNAQLTAKPKNPAKKKALGGIFALT